MRGEKDMVGNQQKKANINLFVHCSESPFENKHFIKKREKDEQMDLSQSNTCKGNSILLKLQ